MMKKLGYIFITVIILFTSCDKNEIKIEPLATISVFNAVVDGKVVKLNTALRDSCLVMNYKHFTILAKNSSALNFFPSGSSSMSYFNQSIDTKAGEIYSVFLTGSHSAPESVLIKDNIPAYPIEDIVNIRFVNLSPNSPALSINLVSPVSNDLFKDVNYKKVTDFISLQVPVVTPIVPYVFQIKNNTGTVLGTFTMPASGTVSVASSRHRNVTLISKGLLSGTGVNAFGIVALPHY